MPDATSQCFLIGKPSNDEILKRQSDAAENRDLIGFRAARMQSRDDLSKFGVNNLCADTRATCRSHCDREITVITNKQRGPEKNGAHFSLAGLIGSQRRYMGSRTDNNGMEELLCGPGRGDDYIGIAGRCIEIVSRLNLDPNSGTVSGRKLVCPVSRNVIDAGPSDRKDQQEHFELQDALRTGTDNGHCPRIGASQYVSGNRASKARSQCGEEARLHYRKDHSGFETGKNDNPLNGRIACRVLGMNLHGVGGSTRDDAGREDHRTRIRRSRGWQRRWHPQRWVE
jgi:hypothetical protein